MLRTLTLSRLVTLIAIVVFVGLPVVAVAASAAISPPLATAEKYSVLAGTTVTNTGPTTVEGDLGVSPGSAVTGFPPGVVGPPGTINNADAAQAQIDAGVAFGALSAVPNATCDVTYDPAQDLAGLTLTPGVYCFPTSAQLTTNQPLTLDGGGDPDAVWIFRMASTLDTTPGVNATVTHDQ